MTPQWQMRHPPQSPRHLPKATHLHLQGTAHLHTHPAYQALESFGYDRETIVQHHYEEANLHYTRVSLAQEDGSAMRLGIIRYDMDDDGTAAVHSFVVEPKAMDDKPDVVRKVLTSLGIDS